MNKGYFEPYIGRTYLDNNPRLLIVGESHYGNGSESSTFTSEVVRDWAMGAKGTRRFFTTIAKLLMNKLESGIGREEKVAFWEKVAFYNYIQSIVGLGARIRPTQEMWEDAKLPFIDVLNELNPHIVIVLGRALSRNIEQIEPAFSKEIVFCYWSHPSSPKYFDRSEALKKYKEAVKKYEDKDIR